MKKTPLELAREELELDWTEYRGLQDIQMSITFRGDRLDLLDLLNRIESMNSCVISEVTVR
jgi:hypothetical protein